MADRYGRRGNESLRLVALVSGLALLATGGIYGLGKLHGSRSAEPTLPHAVVRRVDFDPGVLAPGQVNSAVSTTIECELEAIRHTNEGRSVMTGGASMILEVIADGSTVKKGDVLARLDSSDYEELVRAQAIEVEESRAEYQASLLDLEAAQIQLQEYRDGTLEQTRKQLRGQVALSDATLQRQQDRLEWAQTMLEMTYMSASAYAQEEHSLLAAEIDRERRLMALDRLERYSAPSVIAGLQSQIDKLEQQLRFRQSRLDQVLGRLDSYRKQVEHCTIRAPHDGFVIYVRNDNNETIRIEPGAQVRQRQDLFLLPDLGQMEVATLLHESVVDRVRAGMAADVRVEALPGVRIEGELASIARVPLSSEGRRSAPDVRNFLGIVRLHNVPRGLLPGMSASVRIFATGESTALVIPPDAVADERGMGVCYVMADSGLDRRVVTLGRSTPSLIEVTDGLEEGEQVLLEPAEHVDAGNGPMPLASREVEADGGSVVDEPEVDLPAR